MKTSISNISRVITSQTKSGTIPSELPKQIAAYLLEENRTGDVYSILRTVQQDWADGGNVEAIVTSAFPISSSTRSDIIDVLKKSYPNAKSFKIIEELDQSVVGGVKVNTANEQLDLSIATKLGKFKQLTSQA